MKPEQEAIMSKPAIRLRDRIAAVVLLLSCQLTCAVAQERLGLDSAVATPKASLDKTADNSISGNSISGNLTSGNLTSGNLTSGNSKRWMLLLCGLPGDAEHRRRLTEAVRKLVTAAPTVFQCDNSCLRVLVGDEKMQADVVDLFSDTGVCTRESVAASLESWASDIAPSDTCMVIVLGHAQLYGTRSTFNVQGPDFDGPELAHWMKPIKCRDRVFWITTPVSGFWLKPLSGSRTVVISATEPDLEFTATEMPYALADVLAGTMGVQVLRDIDQDGQLTMLDLYLVVNMEISRRFRSAERLQTEHAQLDDNGDGIGKELQAEFLPAQNSTEDSTEAPPKPRAKAVRTTNSDGDFSSSILLQAPASIVEPNN